MTIAEQNTYVAGAVALIPQGASVLQMQKLASAWQVTDGLVTTSNADLLTAILAFGVASRNLENNLPGTQTTGPTIITVATASTANLTLSGEQTIDGVLTSTSRVLVKDQTTGSQNGIYVTAAGAWARATDYNEASEIEGSYVQSTGGTTQSGILYKQTATSITVGTTALIFEAFRTERGVRWNPFITYVTNAIAAG